MAVLRKAWKELPPTALTAATASRSSSCVECWSTSARYLCEHTHPTALRRGVLVVSDEAGGGRGAARPDSPSVQLRLDCTLLNVLPQRASWQAVEEAR